MSKSIEHGNYAGGWTRKKKRNEMKSKTNMQCRRIEFQHSTKIATLSSGCVNSTLKIDWTILKAIYFYAPCSFVYWNKCEMFIEPATKGSTLTLNQQTGRRLCACFSCNEKKIGSFGSKALWTLDTRHWITQHEMDF